MATRKVTCQHCYYEGKDIVKASSSSGKQHYHCRTCSRYFQLDYVYNAWKPRIKKQIVELAMNSAGARDTIRVLKISIRCYAKKILSLLKDFNIRLWFTDGWEGYKRLLPFGKYFIGNEVYTND